MCRFPCFGVAQGTLETCCCKYDSALHRMMLCVRFKLGRVKVFGGHAGLRFLPTRCYFGSFSRHNIEQRLRHAGLGYTCTWTTEEGMKTQATLIRVSSRRKHHQSGRNVAACALPSLVSFHTNKPLPPSPLQRQRTQQQPPRRRSPAKTPAPTRQELINATHLHGTFQARRPSGA